MPKPLSPLPPTSQVKQQDLEESYEDQTQRLLWSVSVEHGNSIL